MIRCIAALALSAPLCASDIMHVPLLCKHWEASHAAAGAIVGAVANSIADSYGARFVPRLVGATVAALAAGTFKEYMIDHHARPREIPAWGAGAVVVSLAWSITW